MFKYDDFKNLKENLLVMAKDTDEILSKVATDAGQKCYKRAKLNTPVDTGVLRNAWMMSPVEKYGKFYRVIISNPTYYASFVEYGHRQEVGRYVPKIKACLKKPWVEGRFFMTKAVKTTENSIGRLYVKELKQYIISRSKYFKK